MSQPDQGKDLSSLPEWIQKIYHQMVGSRRREEPQAPQPREFRPLPEWVHKAPVLVKPGKGNHDLAKVKPRKERDQAQGEEPRVQAQPTVQARKKPIVQVPEEPIVQVREQPETQKPIVQVQEQPETQKPIVQVPGNQPIVQVQEQPETQKPIVQVQEQPETQEPIVQVPEEPIVKAQEQPQTREGRKYFCSKEACGREKFIVGRKDTGECVNCKSFILYKARKRGLNSVYEAR
ncbi:hypothetical protein L596_006803 [Steinernema carpocapsae]|uniref:Uncharacterized protein n=1 Tax=Steinernema carpocapsae TaxID=34508 RepID=A0A4U5P6T1_STECR|nr:hypothetical protein L596_006803 [Steinernema carpocapsae]